MTTLLKSLSISFLILAGSCTQPVDKIAETEPVPEMQAAPVAMEAKESYDPELAKRLGADEYGMSSYVMAKSITGEDVS